MVWLTKNFDFYSNRARDQQVISLSARDVERKARKAIDAVIHRFSLSHDPYTYIRERIGQRGTWFEVDDDSVVSGRKRGSKIERDGFGGNSGIRAELRNVLRMPSLLEANSGWL